MIATPNNQESAAFAQLRQDARRIQDAAHAAIDALDPSGAIAHARALRSLLWRTEREGLDLRDVSPEDQQ